ncbi:hypothetical protein ARMGADRAFT_1025097 [Armillaria gallica]|uniref:Uncharacterized protein n=1 Tax=Armillaria gallica TaxID=47427 RepID=A0A2H3EE99_ARMGA|nr:hypothetical protein ARMGADRAFT_1025097 [Armillaria gallica]
MRRHWEGEGNWNGVDAGTGTGQEWIVSYPTWAFVQISDWAGYRAWPVRTGIRLLHHTAKTNIISENLRSVSLQSEANVRLRTHALDRRILSKIDPRILSLVSADVRWTSFADTACGRDPICDIAVIEALATIGTNGRLIVSLSAALQVVTCNVLLQKQ